MTGGPPVWIAAQFPGDSIVRRFHLLFIAVLLTLGFAGCSGGSGSTNSPSLPPTAPSVLNFTIDSRSENLGSIDLTWDYPNAAFDAYIAQVSVNGQPYEGLFDKPLDKNTISIQLTWPAQDIPELVLFRFRICTVRGQTQGAFSEASYRRAIIPPTVYARTEGIDGVQLIVSSGSRIAASIEIERSESDGSRPVGGALLLDPVEWKRSSVFWIDNQVEQGKRYYYKCALKYGPDVSTASAVHSGPVELLSVAALRAEPVASTVRLTWKNRNKSTVTQKVVRDGFDHVETDLYPGQQEFVDAVPLPGPYQYRIRTRDAVTQAQRECPAVAAAVANPPGVPVLDFAPMNTGLNSNFSAFSVLPLGGGQFAFAGKNFYGNQLHYFVPSGQSWNDFEPSGSPTPVPGGFFLRPDGAVCVVYSVPNPEFPSTASLLRLAVFDGQSWKSETVCPLSQPPVDQFTGVVKPDSFGNPVINYLHSWSYSETSLMVLANVDGRWSPGLGVQVPPHSGHKFGLAVDRDNTPWIWDGYNLPMGLHKILPLHQIESHPAPPSLSRPAGDAPPIVQVDRENRFHILFDSNNGTKIVLTYLVYNNGAWTEPETVFPGPSGYYSKFFLASKDGNRTCVLLSTVLGLILVERNPTGTWTAFNLAEPGRIIGAWLNPDSSFSAILALIDGSGATSYRMISERR